MKNNQSAQEALSEKKKIDDQNNKNQEEACRKLYDKNPECSSEYYQSKKNLNKLIKSNQQGCGNDCAEMEKRLNKFYDNCQKIYKTCPL